MFCFLFNDASTTWSYTYLHTLSLHDALPIYSSQFAVGIAGCARQAAPARPSAPSDEDRKGVVPLPWLAAPRHQSDSLGRSEEHTSELQSLMRISYAVFCLKKKTITNMNCTIEYIKDKHLLQTIHHIA